jgi:hypothetical protein
VSAEHLECSHCGDAAIESATGLFAEGDTDRCTSCGISGHITVEEDEEAECWIATFLVDDEMRLPLDPAALVTQLDTTSARSDRLSGHVEHIGGVPFALVAGIR